MITDEIVMPVVHLNGTSLDELLDQRLNVLDALRDVMGALKNAAPNQRDYYPAEPGRFELARAQHARRCATVEGLMETFQDEARRLSELGDMIRS